MLGKENIDSQFACPLSTAHEHELLNCSQILMIDHLSINNSYQIWMYWSFLQWVSFSEHIFYFRDKTYIEEYVEGCNAINRFSTFQFPRNN